MPYLFESGIGQPPLGSFVPAMVLRAYEASLAGQLAVTTGRVGAAGVRAEGHNKISHFEYFKLCVSSHYLTCGTPVPTDVDNQIRRKLWPVELPLEVALEMAEFVLESRKWDFTQVSSRFVYGAIGSPVENEALSGHLGEWFTVTAAAYCALKQYGGHSVQVVQEKRQQILDTISEEIHRHSEIFGSLWQAKAGLSCLKAAASISHNFGDLDRVMDMWDLDMGDPLRLQFYKLGSTPFDLNNKLRYFGRLWVASELYKSTLEGSSMASENHRHFALRKPRCLRQSPKLLIPIGPFFDDWGKQVALSLMSPEGVPSENTLEVVAALKHGWERLPNTVGYGRALRGLREVHPELNIEGRTPDSHRCSILEMSQELFEKKWHDRALKEMEDIPSRA